MSNVISIKLSDLRSASVAPPQKWCIVFENDPVTPVDFVAEVICQFCNKTEEEAYQIIGIVEKEGKCPVGAYSREIAETVSAKIMVKASEERYPLKCYIQRV